MQTQFPKVADDYKEFLINAKSTLITRPAAQRIYQACDDTHYFVVDTDRKPYSHNRILFHYDNAIKAGTYWKNPDRIELDDGTVVVASSLSSDAIIGVISAVVVDADSV